MCSSKASLWGKYVSCLQMGYAGENVLLGSVSWREDRKGNLFARSLTFPEFHCSKFAFQGFNSSTLPGCITQPLQQLLRKPDLMPSASSSSESRSAVRCESFLACFWSASGSLTGSAQSDSGRAGVEQVGNQRFNRQVKPRESEVGHKMCLIYSSACSPHHWKETFLAWMS